MYSWQTQLVHMMNMMVNLNQLIQASLPKLFSAEEINSIFDHLENHLVCI